jgi:hypothetical protein
VPLRQPGEKLKYGYRAFLIGLHDQPHGLPVPEAGITECPAKHVQHQIQLMAFLGIDGHTDIARLRSLRQLQQTRDQFLDRPFPLRKLESRVQRGQFDRYLRRVDGVFTRILVFAQEPDRL